jgi:hypothetical protein
MLSSIMVALAFWRGTKPMAHKVGWWVFDTFLLGVELAFVLCSMVFMLSLKAKWLKLQKQGWQVMIVLIGRGGVVGGE